MGDPQVVIVAGVRPQYVKTRAVLWLLERHHPHIAARTVTFDIAQHYSPELSDEIVTDLGFSFTRRLTHASDQRLRGVILGRAISELSTFFDSLRSRPAVIVFGDASSGLAGAFAAHNAQLPLIHVEAGARRDPREIEHHNSVVIDCLAHKRLAYTERAMTELAEEGRAEGSFLVGDVSYDWYRDRYAEHFACPRPQGPAPVLVSMHRPANMTAETMQTVAEALLATGREVRWLDFPRARPYLGPLRKMGVTIVRLMNHQEAIGELARSAYLFTDSGGLSREAHYFRCPVVMRRDVGGWPELAAAGFLYSLTGRTPQDIDSAIMWAESVKVPDLTQSPLIVPGGGVLIADLVRASARGEIW
ncbi:UDP-N-acetylglucosamine 2-epimerase [Streptomyces sp. NPDC057301]|uniref:UDP-N-acetylglucosamine 2-epimerase n=1 Tax=Streptomyces sp. NPDC057301 TaxID=3346093 RepID=UPI00362BBD82